MVLALENSARLLKKKEKKKKGAKTSQGFWNITTFKWIKIFPNILKYTYASSGCVCIHLTKISDRLHRKRNETLRQSFKSFYRVQSFSSVSSSGGE